MLPSTVMCTYVFAMGLLNDEQIRAPLAFAQNGRRGPDWIETNTNPLSLCHLSTRKMTNDALVACTGTISRALLISPVSINPWSVICGVY